MKKLLVILLSLLMLTACGGTSDEEEVNVMQNANVRKAVSYAIDRATLATSLNDGSVAAEGIIPIGLASNPVTGADFRDDQGVVVDFDVELAKSYYQTACEELGVDTISFELLYGTNEGDSVIKAAEQCQYYLEEAGFTVSLNGVQKKERLELMNQGDYDVALTRWGPDYGDPQTYMDLYVSTNESNNSGRYNNADYDAYVAAAEETTDTTERWENFLKAEIVLVQDDAGIVPLYQAGGAMLIRPGVSGIQFHNAAVDNYRHIVGQDTVTIATATDIVYLDTCQATDGTSFIAITNFTSGLTELDENGNPQLDLAESYEMSEDGTVYTFKIRDDAFWSNGEPVTAADFVYAWDRLISEEMASEYAFMVDTCNMESWEALDEKTIQVTLSRPNALLMQILAFPVLFPINQEFCEAQGDQYATSADTVLCCGPYILDSWTPGYSYEFSLNENYWNYDSYVAAGNTSKQVFRVLTDSQTALMEYEQGNMDVVTLSGEQVTAYSGDEGFTTRLAGYLYYLSININHK